MKRCMSLLIAVGVIALLTIAAQNAATHSWPASGQPGYRPVQLQTEQHGVTLTATVSAIVADRDGHLLRVVTLSQVGKLDGKEEILCVGTASPGVNDAWPFGAGSGKWLAKVQPKGSLTWGLVGSSDDLVISVKHE